MGKSEILYNRAIKRIPGGVNSPVRACKSVGTIPRFMKRAEGPYIYDVDNNRYLDYICSFGPMILGHNHPLIKEAVIKAAESGLSFGAATEQEVEMAELICELVPAIDMIRMVNSGTEAVMSALRVARGFTGRTKVIKFNGCYHGHADSMLVKAGSGVMTSGVPDSAGVPEGCAEDTLTTEFNNLPKVEELLLENKHQVAAVIVEPVAANMGVILPNEGFLKGLRELCDREGVLLIFDEVITGFRLGIEGASGYFGIKPDLITFGKIIGAGMPVGAYGGKKEIMEVVAPIGNVYQAGTLSGNPIAMAAGFTQLTYLKTHPQVYTELEQLGSFFRNGINNIIDLKKLSCKVTGIGSLSCIYFTDETVVDYTSAKTSDTKRFANYYKSMLSSGNFMAPSQFEAIFLSAAHKIEDIEYTLSCIEDVF